MMYRKLAGALLCGLVLAGQIHAQTAAAPPVWMLAAAPFSITGRQKVVSKAETLIPTYILDQLSGDRYHRVTPEENTRRSLTLLQTRQQALFLELSAAVRKRDAAVLESPRTSKVTRQIAAEEKKITETKAKLDANTHEIRLFQSDYLQELDVPLTRETRRTLAKKQKEAQKGASKEMPIEKVTLWRNNSDTLYTAYWDDNGKAVDSAQLEKALATEKINTLITGSISIQDEYAAVSVEFRLYPGGLLLGKAMQIGKITNIGDIARVLAFDLLPGVESIRPATLIFNLDENMPKGFTLRVDSNTFSDSAIPGRYPVSAGVHQVSFEAAGYKTESLSMDFAPERPYRLGVRTEKETVNAISLSLRNESKGFFLINGVTHEIPTEGVTVGEQVLLGRFDPEPEIAEEAPAAIPAPGAGAPPGAEIALLTGADPATAKPETGKPETVTPEAVTPETAKPAAVKPEIVKKEAAIPGYFVVPAEAARSSSRAWTVDPFQRDVSVDIEKGRKSLYFSYTLLMISLPILFVALGEFNKYDKAFQSGLPDTETLKTAWDIASWSSIGISVVLGGNFIWRLIRYMRSANPVIPVTAVPYGESKK